LLLEQITEPSNQARTVFLVDLTSGEVKDLLSNISKDSVLSPDQKRIAYLSPILGTTAEGLFVANIDGSQQRLILFYFTEFLGIYHPLEKINWSPDGKWLLITLNSFASDIDQNSEVNLLVNPTSCQYYRININDKIIDAWSATQ
jgi:Tol biopolymer transport system component